jgi:hypothetical protein
MGKRLLQLLIQTMIAFVLGPVNFIVWVVVVFATAAPMILSGLYEATIDRQLLSAIERDIFNYKMQERDLHLSTKNDPTRVQHQVHLLYAVLVGNLQLHEPLSYIENTDPEDMVNRVWCDVKDIIKDLDPVASPEKYQLERERTETRLKTMLSSQASFGTTIFAPVSFFLGSFLFSVFGTWRFLATVMFPFQLLLVNGG